MEGQDIFQAEYWTKSSMIPPFELQKRSLPNLKYQY